MYLRITIIGLILFGMTTETFAQTTSPAVEYLNFMSERRREITKNFMSYTSAVAHGKSARKVENRRKELLKTITDVKKQIGGMAPFEGNKALRDSTVAYLQITYLLLTNDYAKIVDLEEQIEKSYDAMEAYFNIQDAADEKLNRAGEKVEIQLDLFAKNNNIRLIESEDKLSKKVKAANAVNAYQRQVYLIFFKCTNQENYMIEAMNKKNINAIEQSRNTLTKYATENLKKLDTLRAYEADKSMIDATRQMLQFYQTECKDQMPILLDFYVKQDNFDKIRKAFDVDKDHSQDEINEFNKAVNEANAGVKNFNSTQKSLNQKRNTLLENWNKTSSKFLDSHTPKY